MKRIKHAEFIPADDEEVVFETIDSRPELNDYDQKIEEFANDMQDLAGETAEILVKRQTGDGKSPMAHIGVFLPDEFTFSQLVEHLRKEFGGGLYRIYLRADGRNRKVHLIRIDEPKNKPSNTVGGEVSEVLGRVLGTISNQHQQMIQLMSSGGSRKEMFEEILLIKQLFDSNKPDTSNPMAQMRETIELMQMMGVEIGQKEDAGFANLLEKFAPVVQAAVNAPPRPQPKHATGDPMFQNMAIKLGLKQLLKGAQKNSDPALYAGMILDQLPETVIQQFIVDTGAMDKLLKMEPAFNTFKPWLLNVSEHVKAQLGMASTVSAEYEDISNNPETTHSETDSDIIDDGPP